MTKITKVVKLYLISSQQDKDGNDVDYHQVNKILWSLQDQVREIKNKSIQYCWEWAGFSSDYNKRNGEYPKEKDILNYSLSGFVYDKFKKGYDLYSCNVSCATRDACTAFSNAKKELYKGTKSVINYKSNQPIELHNKSIALSYENKMFYVSLKLLNREGSKKYGMGTSMKFLIVVKDKSTQIILERCIDGIYSIAGSKLMYDKKKRMWRLNLSYSFSAEVVSDLDSGKILGVDLGIVSPICASVYGDLHRLTINGGEIESFTRKVEARKRSLQRQGTTCGDGRIGHGRNKRNAPVYKISDKIARFRDTANHKYSRALIDYAIKNGCGIIQMEDLSGITADADKFMKKWPYYDLQTKIENKAKEVGISVKYIKPKYTSQRCSKCGYINKDNRQTQAKFICGKCGFETNADYNASQNIAVMDIDKIIEETVCENSNEDESEKASA